jgi:hypothetical protein
MPAPKGNKFALNNNGGRPPIFDSPDQLLNKCKSYFDYCKTQKEKATITGLALYLGFEATQSLIDYEKHEEYSFVIKRAKLAVQNSYELAGQTIDIFALKQLGWKDRTEVTGKDGNPFTVIMQPAAGCEPINDEP